MVIGRHFLLLSYHRCHHRGQFAQEGKDHIVANLEWIGCEGAYAISTGMFVYSA